MFQIFINSIKDNISGSN